MKKEIFGTFALFSWVPFFLNMAQNWPDWRGYILAVLGLAALYFTLELLTVERESKGTFYVTGSPWTLVSLLIWIVFCWIAHKLSLYWSLLVPLLAVVLAYVLARLWPDAKREE